jgi:single-stranded DNA-specific DHH superfamily exonuclease
LNHEPRLGLRALIAVSSLAGKRITSGHVAFVLAPRINAAGRMGNASRGCGCCSRAIQDEAETLARSLEEDNVLRRKHDEQVLIEAVRQVEEEVGYPDCSSILLWSDRWHPGVIGIVASRLVERFQRPDDPGRARWRTRPRLGAQPAGLDLTRLLDGCGDLLLAHGGHAFAAGLTVQRERLPELRERLERLVREQYRPDQFVQRLELDADLRAATATWSSWSGSSAWRRTARQSPTRRSACATPARARAGGRRAASTCGCGRATTAARSRRSASAWATRAQRCRAPGAPTWRSCPRATSGRARRASSSS